MARFKVSTKCLDFTVGFFIFVHVLYIFVHIAEFMLATSHYTFTTSCDLGPECRPWISFIGDFRPASTVQEYAGLDDKKQQTTLYYSLYYFLITSQFARIAYIIPFLIFCAYYEYMASIPLVGITYGVLIVWEGAKMVFWVLGLIDHESYFYAFGPYVLSSEKSYQFWVTFGTTAGAMIYILFTFLCMALIYILSRMAQDREEESVFNVPGITAMVGNNINQKKKNQMLKSKPEQEPVYDSPIVKKQNTNKTKKRSHFIEFSMDCNPQESGYSGFNRGNENDNKGAENNFFVHTNNIPSGGGDFFFQIGGRIKQNPKPKEM